MKPLFKNGDVVFRKLTDGRIVGPFKVYSIETDGVLLNDTLPGEDGSLTIADPQTLIPATTDGKLP